MSENENDLPEDGAIVTAHTIPSIEHDRPATQVRGKLAKRWVPRVGGYWQCTVDDAQVDADSVRVAQSQQDSDD